MRAVRLATASRPRRKPVDLASVLATQLTQVGIKGWVREHHFHPERQWRLDIAFPVAKIGVECEGLAPKGTAGRHQLTQHMHHNTEKHSAIAVAGWRLLRVTGLQIRSGHALKWIEAALAGNVAAFDSVQDWDGLWRAVKGRRRG